MARVRRSSSIEVNRMGLSETVHPANALLQARRVPWRLKIDHRRGRLKVQSNTAGIGGEKYFALGIAPEFLHKSAPISRGHAAVQRDESDPQLLELFAGQVGHAFVLAEDHHLAAFFDHQLADDLAKLGELRRMVGLLVEEKRGIAEHPHILQAAQDTFLVDVGEPALDRKSTRLNSS